MQNPRKPLVHKPLAQQVVVLTGATSGIGLCTARKAAQQGAKLVLASRDEASLRILHHELTESGTEVVTVTADVGVEADVERIAAAALQKFGGFDTWVNNAGASAYGKLDEIPMEDHRRLFETNFWGVVYGSLAAVRHLRQHGGTLINVGSEVSEVAIPLQGMYSASKHAVKGFTDALRTELEHDGAPVQVTLIKPGAIDTPYRRHAADHLQVEPQLPPPVYAPDVVAQAILYCAQHPLRDLFVGGSGKAHAALGRWLPRLMDKVGATWLVRAQQGPGPQTPIQAQGLHEPGDGLHERGGYEGHVAKRSLYTLAAEHPVALVSLLGATVAATLAMRAARGA